MESGQYAVYRAERDAEMMWAGVWSYVALAHMGKRQDRTSQHAVRSAWLNAAVSRLAWSDTIRRSMCSLKGSIFPLVRYQLCSHETKGGEPKVARDNQRCTHVTGSDRKSNRQALSKKKAKRALSRPSQTFMFHCSGSLTVPGLGDAAPEDTRFRQHFSLQRIAAQGCKQALRVPRRIGQHQ